MKKGIWLNLLLMSTATVVFVGTCCIAANRSDESAAGPLRVHPDNPRYFTDGAKKADGSLKAVYLTGSHTRSNLVNMDKADPPAPFDHEAYLDFLERYGHNPIFMDPYDGSVLYLRRQP